MANYKVVNADQLDTDLTSVADAIREKTGGSETLSFPDGMVQALNSLPGLIVSTVTGSIITLTDSVGLKLRGLKLFGKTTQDGTPSPEAPVELVSAGHGGSIGVTVAGKNILNVDDMLNDVLAKDGDEYIITKSATGRFSKKTDIFIPANTPFLPNVEILEYTNRNYLQVHMLYAGGGEATISVNPKYPTKQTFPKDIVSVGLFIDVTDPVGSFIRFKNLQIQFKDDNVPTSYEPYKEAQTLTLSTPHGLRGIPVTSGGSYTDETGQQWVCDEVDYKRGVHIQRIHRIVLDAAVFDRYSSYPRTLNNKSVLTFYPVPSIAGTNGTGQSGTVMMSNFTDVIGSSTDSECAMWENGTNGTMQCNIAFSTAYVPEATKEAFITFFTANPGEILIGMPDPIKTVLSAEELAAYATLHTNYPNTTILNDAGAGMSVSYVADTKLYIDNKINAMAAAIVNA